MKILDELTSDLVGVYTNCVCRFLTCTMHSYDILGARMLWKPKEARILKNFIEF
jgi:hypothetical protein